MPPLRATVTGSFRKPFPRADTVLLLCSPGIWWPAHLRRPPGSGTYTTSHHIHVIKIVFLMAALPQGSQSHYARASLHTVRLTLTPQENQNPFQLVRDGLFQNTHLGRLDGDDAFCFTPFQNGRSDHKFTVGLPTALSFSIIVQKEEREKKSIFLMLSWGRNIF